MAMMIVAIPFYDRDMQVQAYVFRYQKDNPLFSAAQTTNLFDGGMRSAALDTLNLVGLDAFTLGRPIFVPIDYFNLLGNFAGQRTEFPEKVIFVFEEPPKPDDALLAKMDEYRALGYRFGVNHMDSPEKYAPVLSRCDFYFLSQRPEDAEKSRRILGYLKASFAGIAPVATHVRSADMMKSLDGAGYALYESRFSSVGVTEGATRVSPLKANTIRLLNIVQDEHFEFDEVGRIVQGDPALTISLLRMVNAQTGMRNQIKTIPHAVAMLGQKEVRRWVTTAVSQSLGADKPNEITRISLIRAKFSENLAPLFEIAHMSQELFLMGLFSVLDIILEVPMAEALRVVHVSDVIRKALVEQAGLYAPVLLMLTDYENAAWPSVSRRMIVQDISENDLSDAYIQALIWYRDLIHQAAGDDATGAGKTE